MNRILNWYKNTKLSHRVILSMNLAIFLSILIISIFATINRINVQKQDARNLVHNELNQITTLLDFLQERPLDDLDRIISSRTIYNTGFISLVNSDGEVLICRERQGQNISSTHYFLQMHGSQRGETTYTDPVTDETNFQYFTFYPNMDLYVIATLEKSEVIDKPVYNTLGILLFALIFTWITFSVVNYFIMKTITTPINGLIKVVKQLGKGDLADTFHYPYKDEVGQMAGSVNDLVRGLKQTAIFANEIGKNNFDHPFEPLSSEDMLGNALLDMRQSLKAAHEEEQIRKIEDEKRNWTTQGLAKFADILRKNNDNITELSYDIIRNLVEYLDINQGGVFILNDEDKNDKFLELTACYAFDRRKYLDKKILPGEGLVGTCFMEQEPIYVTDIPQDYIRITSGLGDENPSALLLIPLKVNDQIFGVIELASFSEFEKYKLEFVEKIGESIASTISSVKINTQTAALLEKSQQQAEEMRAQEEEMRQNMEELSATQESMAEKEKENLKTIEELNKQIQHTEEDIKLKEKELVETLEECPNGVVRTNTNGIILFFNKAAEQILGYNRNEVVGQDIKMLMPEQDALNYDQEIQSYLKTGHKKNIRKDLPFKTKPGEVINIYLTTVQTRIGEEIFITGFFSAPKTSGGNQPSPDSPETGSPQQETPGNADNKKAGESKDTNEKTEDSRDMHQDESADPQKAWSEHIRQKGKTFRKGKKK